MEIHAAIVVGFRGRRKIQIDQRNFLRVLRRETPQRSAYDGIILHFLLVLIAEYQDCGRQQLRVLFLARRSRWPRIRILIAGLSCIILSTHIISVTGLILLLLIILRTRIPPPVGINASA